MIIAGINPNSGGHAYNQVNLSRQHVRMDQEILLRLMQQGYPIFTTDPSVSEAIGLPLSREAPAIPHLETGGDPSVEQSA